MAESTERTLHRLTTDARDTLLRALDFTPGGDADAEAQALIGQCPRNAAVLLSELHKQWNDGDVVLRVGALDTQRAPVFPDDIAPYPDYWTYLKDHSMIHYWVEVSREESDTVYYCDLAADRRFSSDADSSKTGQPFVDTELPEEYVPLDATHTPTELSNGETPHNLLVLWRAVWSTRQRLLTEAGATEATSHHLDGICHETSEALLRELNNTWNTSTDSLHTGEYPHRADHYIQFGGILTDEHTPDNFQRRLDVERAGTDHFWVEAIDINLDRYYILDCFSNDPDTYGQPIVRTTYPDSYVPVSDGRFPPDSVLHHESWWRALT